MIQGKLNGRLHAIVRNFVLDLVTDMKDMIIDGRPLSFFLDFKINF